MTRDSLSVNFRNRPHDFTSRIQGIPAKFVLQQHILWENSLLQDVQEFVMTKNKVVFRERATLLIIASLSFLQVITHSSFSFHTHFFKSHTVFSLLICF